MNVFRMLTVAAALALTACATNYSQRLQAQLQRYQDAAGEPVQSFRYFSFNSWTALGREHIAVWTRPKEAWLLELSPMCFDLDFAHSIALTSSINRVYARFDSVLVGKDRCRIESIRPIDVSKLRDLQREARTDIEARNSDKP
jgi:Family of unknown function (DUF6491)